MHQNIALPIGEETAIDFFSIRLVAVALQEIAIGLNDAQRCRRQAIGLLVSGISADAIAEIERRGGKAIGVALDLHDDDAIGALFDRVNAEQGRLDILVNNAMAIPDSMTSKVPFWEKPLADEWDIWDIG